MQFSIRFLLLIPLLFVAGFLARDQAFRWHHKRIEPSLYFHIVTNEVGPSKAYKFAIGHPVDADWKEPSSSLIAELSATNIRPFSDENAIVFFVDRIKWTGWNSVSIDYGTYHSANECEGTECAEFRYTNGVWHSIEPGEKWITRTRDACDE